MSWSNVCDYCVPADFHDMARRCSIAGDTVHYANSINWPREIHVNMPGAMYETIYEAILQPLLCALSIDWKGDSFTETRKKLLSTAKNTVALTYRHAPNQWDQILVLPPLDNAMNYIDYCMSGGYHQNWVDAFVATGQGSASADAQSCRTVSADQNASLIAAELALLRGVEISPYNFMSKTGPVISMTFTYDPKLSFKPV
eukprot:6022-Heterococcus_DN1.PRE.2